MMENNNEHIHKLLEELSDVRSSEFYLQMKDHWSNTDFDIDRKYKDRIRTIEEELRSLGVSESVIKGQE